MSIITVYQKPTCTTCREVHKALVASGVDFESVEKGAKAVLARPAEKLKEIL